MTGQLFELTTMRKRMIRLKASLMIANKKLNTESVNSLLNKKNENSTPTSLDDNAEIISGPTKICKIFNDYFFNIGTKLANKLPDCAISFKSYLPTIESNFSFQFEEIDTPKTVNIVRNLNSKKTSGYDQLTTRSMEEIIILVLELVNMMFRESVFPDCLKVAKVITNIKIRHDKL